MTSAASARASMPRRSGSVGVSFGAIFQRRAHRIRVSATDVRELMSSASVRDLLDRHAAEQRHRRDRPVRPDRDAGHDVIVAAQVLDRRDQAEVDAALVQQRGALRRHVEADREQVRPAPRGRPRAAWY